MKKQLLTVISTFTLAALLIDAPAFARQDSTALAAQAALSPSDGDLSAPFTPQSGPTVPDPETPSAPREQVPSSASSADYCKRNLGSWFYCDAPAEDQQAKANQPPAQAPVSRDDADLAAVAKFKKDMDEARLIAVWNPSDENLHRYFRYQQVVLDRSGTFADKYRRMIWADPSLDYTLKRPVTDQAKTEWVSTRETDRDLFFRGIYDRVGIFYVFRETCAPCREAGPIIYNFGQRYGIGIHAISTDGSQSNIFPDARADHGQLASWGIKSSVTPAYLIYQSSDLGTDGAVHPVTIRVSDEKVMTLRPCTNPHGCLTYLGAGVMSMDDLADRLFVTLGTEPGKDF